MSFMVAPSLLSADFSRLGEEIAAIEQAGCDWLHMDVMDGHFVPNLTFGPPVLKSLRPCSKKTFDVHLMIEHPEKWIERYAEAGADNLTIHVETTPDPLAVLKKIRQLGKKAGITLRPSTALQRIEPFLDAIDLVLVMTVEPGFSGQKFMGDQIAKITALRRAIDTRRLPVLIEVDGGIDDTTAPLVRDADVLVAGNFVFKNDYRVAIAKLKQLGE